MCLADADARSEEAESDVGVQGQEGHGDGGVGDFLVQHEGGEAQAKAVIVVSGVPDGDAVGLPGFDGSHGEGVVMRPVKVPVTATLYPAFFNTACSK